MSRLIVKNLPPSITKHKFQSMFEAIGTVTDCKLKYSKNGQFRHFGFVGFRSHQEAEKAVQQFHNSFLNAVRIQVEFCKDLSGKDTPMPWRQKRAKVKEILQTKQKEMGKAEKTAKFTTKKEKDKQSSASSLLLGELQDDPDFQEFLQAHQSKATRPMWTDTVGMGKTQDGSEKARKTQADKLLFNEEEDDIIELEGRIEETVDEKTAHQERVSDMEYLKSKVVQTSVSSVRESGEEEEEDKEVKGEGGCKDRVTKKMTASRENADHTDPSYSRHMLRMKGVPYKATEKNIKEFFYPLNIQAIKIHCTRKGKGTGVVDVGFTSEKDQLEALKRDKDYMGTRFIELALATDERRSWAQESSEKEQRPWEKKSQKAGDEDESIAESGRLFIRNLPYLCKEDDLEGLFTKYGPLTECHIPIDTFTRKATGIAFVTFMIPEHAVNAFSQLDGTVFMGRLLHILPSRGRNQDGGPGAKEGDFKKKKEADQKAKAGSFHNWNSLFLGENAVADVMAEKYGTSKSHVLDADSRESLAVRMALGETQIVAETRQFLLDNGVKLDSFSQPAAARSKTVLLVKNLPAGTEPNQLQGVFSKFGQLGRVVLPPAGVTAIVEFLEPSEARGAFYKLAYTKFQHVPLYLEWAPTKVFSTPNETETTQKQEQESGEHESAEQEDSDSDEDPGQEERGKCTLFLKNLNFDTSESALKQKFSSCGIIRNVSIATKKDMSNPGKLLSMGYGFVEFQKREFAQKALKDLQHCEVDGHRLELKVSNRALQKEDDLQRKPVSKKKPRSSKILVRNIPFQANKREVQNLFSTFGEIKFVRLPQKFGSTQHRGFGFVEFLSKQDAKRAFNALVHSTHLYGRRLVLEWADTQETVDELRKKTAEHYHNEPAKKKGKSSVSEGELITKTQKER
ncbi:probable RNA-binding protein 19 isoform X1 [Branchiostoma lanceolatum]|uniref:probable RNA-binding protein 19 isoform X1 n=1 Tax=Branchiostoma lanceolatum TaxID=7740 RepID=UPI003455F402